MMIVDMANGISSWTHGRGSNVVIVASCSASNTVLAGTALSRTCGAGRLAAVSRTRRWCRCLMQLLLMAQQQIASGKASRALGAFEWLLFRMRALMTFQMLQASEGPRAGCTDMGARLIGLWWWKVITLVGIDGNGGSC